MQSKKWQTRPLRETIREIAFAVAEGQAELDRSIIDLQRELTEAFERGEIDQPLTPQQFRFADVDIDLKMIVTQSVTPEKRPDDDQPRAYKPRINATLLSPESRQRENLERELVSTVNTRIVPVPPERPDNEQ